MFNLSFLYPAFLLGALAAAVPVILHLLRHEAAPQVSFSAVRFLRSAPVERARRSRLTDLLLLPVSVVALLLLAFSYARPYLSTCRAAGGTSGVTVIAIDTSFSMSAPGQFERARLLARQAVDATPASHLVSVMSFD